MSITCAHLCCEIPGNPYHVHLRTPAGCRRCERAAVVAGEPIPAVTLATLVAEVVIQVAPQIAAIAGLPDEPERSELIAAKTVAVYAQGIVDPDVQALDEHDRHAVLAARVGLELAFPS